MAYFFSLITIFIAIIILIFTIIYYFKHFNKQNTKIEKLWKERKITSHNLFETHKYNNKQILIQQISLTFTGLLIITTLLIGLYSTHEQINIANKNLEQFKETQSSNWADVEINYRTPPEKFFVVDSKCLANIDCSKHISLIAINSGKINTGEIYLDFLHGDNLFETEISPNTFMNITPTSAKYLDIEINQKNCNKNTPSLCDETKLPSGRYNLTIQFKCDFCKPEQREGINFIIPICVYRYSYSDCN